MLKNIPLLVGFQQNSSVSSDDRCDRRGLWRLFFRLSDRCEGCTDRKDSTGFGEILSALGKGHGVTLFRPASDTIRCQFCHFLTINSCLDLGRGARVGGIGGEKEEWRLERVERTNCGLPPLGLIFLPPFYDIQFMGICNETHLLPGDQLFLFFF